MILPLDQLNCRHWWKSSIRKEFAKQRYNSHTLRRRIHEITLLITITERTPQFFNVRLARIKRAKRRGHSCPFARSICAKCVSSLPSSRWLHTNRTNGSIRRVATGYEHYLYFCWPFGRKMKCLSGNLWASILSVGRGGWYCGLLGNEVFLE